ncbi:MAG: choice-of-anchor V domain-containing protein, partial [Longimicrobiales bacterium]|nr:choice-of-anchor V domain-containing protein [Longimicrobiales bacterium]
PAGPVDPGPAGPPPPLAAHLSGPPPGHTGGFGEPTCRICHEGDPLNAYGGSVRILGLPTAYRPGGSYAVSVVLEASGTAVAGFQLAARFEGGTARGRAAGRVEPMDPRVAVTVGEDGQPYAHHTVDGTAPTGPDGSQWILTWTAPAGGGTVVFHVASNSGNGDNSPLMDLIYTARAEVAAAPPGG